MQSMMMLRAALRASPGSVLLRAAQPRTLPSGVLMRRAMSTLPTPPPPSTASSSSLGLSRTLLSRALAPCRRLAAAAGTLETQYPVAMQWLHWAVGAGVLTCVGTVKLAQQFKAGKTKGMLMLVHKSTALLVLALLAPRVVVRLASRMPVAAPGAAWQQLASRVSHFALYVAMIAMPVSGVAMGYFGGKGLPFFWTKFDGAAEPNGAVAKRAFQFHTTMGQALEILLAVHVGATALHLARGENILARIGIGRL